MNPVAAAHNRTATHRSGPDRKAVGIAAILPKSVKLPQIEALLTKIRKTYRPGTILLFGSRARGDNRPDSDWDLLILLPKDAPEALLDPYLRWEVKRGTGVKADIQCEYEDDFLGNLDVVNTLAYEIKSDAVRVV